MSARDRGALTLLPAVDVAAGRVVRQPGSKAESQFADGDPLAAALAWQDAGARWIHLVDIDAAFGCGSNCELLAEIVGRLDVKVELSGGIRDQASLTAALTTGCARVVISTAALGSPGWVCGAIASHGEKIAVGLDVCGTALAARGGNQQVGELVDTLAWLAAAGCPRYVVTDVWRDGMLSGPNVPLLRDVCAVTDRPVIASGGVASLDDLRALASLASNGVEGAIVGKALYSGAFTLPQALAAVA